jgi:uncharacterized protein YecE (DUF72 family)
MSASRPRQPGLFGDPPPESEPEPKPERKRRSSRAVGPADVPDALQAVARALPEGVHLGTSSWSFPGWEDIVYDRKASKSHLARQGLAAYAEHPLLRAVGIDRTYYAPIGAGDFAEYATMVPDDFRFLVKAAGDCTTPWVRDATGRPEGDNPSYLDAAWATDAVVGPYVEGLGDKAGTLVFQFPPQGRRIAASPGRFAERLERFLSALPEGPAYTVELRNRELFGAEYVEALKSAGAGHCHNVHPRMPSIAEQARVAAGVSDGPFVARWMLNGGLDYEAAIERYEPFCELVDEDPTSRRTLAGIAREETFHGRVVIIVANNKAEGSAPLTVFRLAEEIVG